jgi:excisionase family DNA binding protein
MRTILLNGNPPLMRVSQVATYLDVDEHSVYRWISNKTLPAVRLGAGPKAAIRVAASDLELFLRGGGSR